MLGYEEMKSKNMRGIIDKCGEEPNLFYIFMNKKLKHKEGIIRLRNENRVYEDSKGMSDLLNISF